MGESFRSDALLAEGQPSRLFQVRILACALSIGQNCLSGLVGWLVLVGDALVTARRLARRRIWFEE